MVKDPIADMLARIRNAEMVGKETVRIPLSKFKLALAKAFKKTGAVRGVVKKDRNIVIKLTKGHLSNMKLISRLSQRIYLKAKDIRPSLHSLKIISTSKGLMSDREARAKKLGGEIICEIK